MSGDGIDKMDPEPPFEMSAIAPEPEVVVTPKKHRRLVANTFVVITDDGVVVVDRSRMIDFLRKHPGADVYELGRRLVDMSVQPGIINLTTGEVGEDRFEFKYKEGK